MSLTEETGTGSTYLRRVTELLQDVRNSHPTAGVWEAADFQWWWRKARPSDQLEQMFWRDSGSGETVGAVTRTDWRGSTALDVIALPSCSEDTRRALWVRALELVVDTGEVEVLIDEDDVLAHQMLNSAGFVDTENRGVSTWLNVDALPPVSTLSNAYELASRADHHDLPHHLNSERNGFDVEQRLQETSLYRRDLDLFVVDADGQPVSHGLFWFDPTTSIGFVEPMGTHEPHRRIGLAQHLLTSGVGLLVNAGATRVKVNYEANNPASKMLYLSTGFQAVMATAMLTRQKPPSRIRTDGSADGVDGAADSS